MRLSTPDLVSAIRVRAGISQEELARRMGVSFASVNAWERGRIEPRSVHRDRFDAMARIPELEGTVLVFVTGSTRGPLLAEAERVATVVTGPLGLEDVEALVALVDQPDARRVGGMQTDDADDHGRIS